MTFLIVLSIVALIYVPNRDNFNSLAHSGHLYLKFKASKRRELAYEKRHPTPDPMEVLKAEKNAKAIARQKALSTWESEFNPPATPISTTNSKIPYQRFHKPIEDLTYTQRMLKKDTVVYLSPYCIAGASTLSQGTIVNIKFLTHDGTGNRVLGLSNHTFIYAEESKPGDNPFMGLREIHPSVCEPDSYTVKDAAGKIIMQASTPIDFSNFLL